MVGRLASKIALLALLALLVLLGGCAGPPPAPVEDRSAGDAVYGATPDGHYRVRRGDTLYSIAFRYGLDWRQLAGWNDIAPPYLIHPDDLLRLGPSGTATPISGREADTGAPGVSVRPATGAGVATTRALETPRVTTTTETSSAEDPPPTKAADGPGEAVEPAGPGPAAGLPGEPGPTNAPPATPTTARATKAVPVVPGADPDQWLWPAEGRILSRFVPGDTSKKGVDIAGDVGRPIHASAGGVVVYSGSGLIGYGELIIIKHSDRMLSAYAHNSKRLVAEGQQVAAGDLIAEMGTNDRNQAVLHFEIRVNGSPADPLKYLPPR